MYTHYKLYIFLYVLHVRRYIYIFLSWSKTQKIIIDPLSNFLIMI